MNNDYEAILDWWSGLPIWDQTTYKNKYIGNSVSLSSLNEAHVTFIYREVLEPEISKRNVELSNKNEKENE